MHLGEQVRQRVLDLFGIKLLSKFKGCTDDEIEEVKEFQNIQYIPQAYRDLLQIMGKSGLSWIAMGEANWDLLKKIKGSFESHMQWRGYKYPADLLVFFAEMDVYYFVRTRDQHDDPPVYSNGAWWREGGVEREIAKMAESLSEFWLMLVVARKRLSELGSEGWKPMAGGYYDPELDEYVIDYVIDE